MKNLWWRTDCDLHLGSWYPWVAASQSRLTVVACCVTLTFTKNTFFRTLVLTLRPLSTRNKLFHRKSSIWPTNFYWPILNRHSSIFQRLFTFFLFSFGSFLLFHLIWCAPKHPRSLSIPNLCTKRWRMIGLPARAQLRARIFSKMVCDCDGENAFIPQFVYLRWYCLERSTKSCRTSGTDEKKQRQTRVFLKGPSFSREKSQHRRNLGADFWFWGEEKDRAAVRWCVARSDFACCLFNGLFTRETLQQIFFGQQI